MGAAEGMPGWRACVEMHDCGLGGPRMDVGVYEGVCKG